MNKLKKTDTENGKNNSSVTVGFREGIVLVKANE